MIDIRQLRYFVAVCEERHFGRAAERLHITQPPLSHAIRKLEEELGVELLVRTSRTVTVTEAGQVFADDARKVIASFDRAVSDARRGGGSPATRAVRVGCHPYLPIDQLLTFLSELRHREPDLTVEVSHLETAEQVRRLRDGGIDAGLFARAEELPDLTLETLFPGEPLAGYVAPDHPLATKSVLTPDDLRDETLITIPRSSNRGLFDELLQRLEQAGYRFAALHEAGGATPRDLFFDAASGTGIVITLSSLRHTSDLGGLVVSRPLDPTAIAPETVMARLAARVESMREVGGVLESVAAELRGETAPRRESERDAQTAGRRPFDSQ